MISVYRDPTGENATGKKTQKQSSSQGNPTDSNTTASAADVYQNPQEKILEVCLGRIQTQKKKWYRKML